ncbi:HNH endonuclease [Klebsiella phage vB_KaeM_Merci]|nr:HNH endonuclease [Klebsiella phage vB_KaeM_Merci]
MGGSDDKENLVLLTAEEHYLAHKYLAKIYPNHYGVLTAWWNMSNTNTGNRQYYISAKDYAEAKKLFSKAQSNKLKEYYKNPSNRIKQSNTLKAFYSNSLNLEKHKEALNRACSKEKMSIARINFYKDPNNIKNAKIIQNSIEVVDKKKKGMRKSPIWHEPMYTKLYDLWIDSNKPKCGRFTTIAISKGFPNVNYKGLVEYDFFKKL